MKKIITLSLALGGLSLGQICAAQSYNKGFVESEKGLAKTCVSTYQSAPKDGAKTISICLAQLEKMKALKGRTAGLTYVDNRLYSLYSAMAMAALTMGDLAQNSGRISPAACLHGREAVALGRQVNFQNGSDYAASVQQMVVGLEKKLIPLCAAK